MQIIIAFFNDPQDLIGIYFNVLPFLWILADFWGGGNH